ncbi:MAG: hypothetical protein E5X23_11950 [Mesorhizobium sp.]|uniref:hypothetical protein n=1 Tax=Mesorhizobium sp. TaxID=1871066 RepID=UPI000FEA93DF|nr:hypothetical protein [Mesorhizobium sp.]RWH52572.1 MAG: hypothetical protein EOQ81_22905 [Mesorhizobium sp.]TJV81539.1 MAG: hypothetical protein E5X23_11950 [Mesorhizobium sp.]
MKRAGTHKRLGGWRGSAAQIAVGRAAIRAWNAERHLAPKCGAKAKSHGGSCRQIAMANGRCYLHGGKVPSGDGYHRPMWPNRDAPDAEAKLNRKLNDLQRAAAKRAKRVAAMTPDERATYEAWQRSHKPGSATAREQARAERKQNAELREMMAAARPAATGEAAALESQIAMLRAELDERRGDDQKPIGAFA